MKKVYYTTEYSIERDKKGYYTLFVNGQFEGNFDSVMEAIREVEKIKTERDE